jgi:hypothetical protein
MTIGPMPDLPDFCWPVDVSCVPDWDTWAVEPDPDADPPVVGVPLYSDADKDRAIALAGQTLRFLTGYRVGGCPTLVRPCRKTCGSRTWRTYDAAWSGGSGAQVPWWPVDMGGTWLNIGCGCGGGGCSCTHVSEVRLYGPVGAVVEVKVDGEVLTPQIDYRVDPGGRLVRLGAEWPLCQDLNLADTEEGTWSVSYTAGAPVDGLGAWVAGILAGEYVRACSGGECRLPTGVTQIIRDGVNMTIGAGVFPGNLTGIREVDAWVARWNPTGLRSPAVVWSPDRRGPRSMG